VLTVTLAISGAAFAAGEGTGLGLSMSHDIIVKQHGTIEVETEPGLFAEFKIVLPRTSQR